MLDILAKTISEIADAIEIEKVGVIVYWIDKVFGEIKMKKHFEIA